MKKTEIAGRGKDIYTNWEIIYRHDEGNIEKVDTMFNHEKIKIIICENGGNVEYKYSFFKTGFEEWAKNLKMHLPEVHDLEMYLRECGYNVKEIKELRV